MSGVLASIPSPSTGVYHVGPLTIHMYGLMLLLGIAASIWLTGRRWVKLGGDWDLVYRVAIWGVVFGIVGARIYHLITSWNQGAETIYGYTAAEVIGPTLEGKTERQKNPHPPRSLAWLAWIVARLGGWNCYYKPPGPKTMRAGWTRLAAMADGYAIALAAQNE